MSESLHTGNANFRPNLLATASMVALLASFGLAPQSRASDNGNDEPTVWIELGGQLERQTGQGDAFIPDFVTNNLSSKGFKGVDFQSQKPANFSNGLEGQLTFEPEDSRWIFSAAIRYGRANSNKNLSHITPGQHLHHKSLYADFSYTNYDPRHIKCCITISYTPALDHPYANLQSKSDQTHAIVDFQAGREVGLGLFGGGGTSFVTGGVRFAQFVSKSNATIHGRPSRDFEKHYIHYRSFTYSRYRTLPTHRYAMSENNARDFHGVGPAISWNGTAPVLGNPQAGELELDWGANAALLFGRQRAAGSHESSAINNFYYSHTQTHHSGSFNRKRSVVVPNFGGFAGFSFRYSDAKLSLGYRGDFFFGAMDAGNDTRKAETVGFYGPFATISIGIGG